MNEVYDKLIKNVINTNSIFFALPILFIPYVVSLGIISIFKRDNSIYKIGDD